MAEIFYQATEFENALVFYHRGKKLRSVTGEFVFGVIKAEEAINNVIGGMISDI